MGAGRGCRVRVASDVAGVGARANRRRFHCPSSGRRPGRARALPGRGRWQRECLRCRTLARCSTMHSGRGVTEHASGRSRRRAAARGDDAVGDNPFALLGLPARPGLSDDDVRAAWRRIAAATHPDREDGGDPARFGAAAAAYVMLRTGFGRGEALADLGLSGAAEHRGRRAHRHRRSADPAASGAGRHRARRETPADRRTGARLPGLTRLRGWITRRATAHDPPDAPKQGPVGAAAPMSAGGTAHGSGGGTAWVPGQGTAPVPGEGTARVSGEGTARVPAGGPRTGGRRWGGRAGSRCGRPGRRRSA